MLLLNLGNIDWRALLNLWSVLEYLTKYTTKGGKGSRNMGRLFEEVLLAMHQHEEEDGIHDLLEYWVITRGMTLHWYLLPLKFMAASLRNLLLRSMTVMILSPLLLSNHPSMRGIRCMSVSF